MKRHLPTTCKIHLLCCKYLLFCKYFVVLQVLPLCPLPPHRPPLHSLHHQDVGLLDLCRIVCALLDIPLDEERPVEALHLLFSAFLEIKASPWLGQHHGGNSQHQGGNGQHGGGESGLKGVAQLEGPGNQQRTAALGGSALSPPSLSSPHKMSLQG